MTKFLGPVPDGVALACFFAIVCTGSVLRWELPSSSNVGGRLPGGEFPTLAVSTSAPDGLVSRAGMRDPLDGAPRRTRSEFSVRLADSDDIGVPATTLCWTSPDGDRGRSTSGLDGVVEMEVPSGVRIRLSVADPHRALPAQVLTEFAPGERRELGTVFLVPARTLRGRVLGPDQQPLVGALVEGTSNDSVLDILNPPATGFGLDPSILAAVRTDSSGHFEIRGVGPGSCFVRATYPGLCATRWEARRVSASGTRPVELVLRAGRSIRGQVIGPTGAPARGARIGAWSGNSPIPMVQRAAEIAQAGAALSGSGEFELKGLPMDEDVVLIAIGPGGELDIAVVERAEDRASFRLHPPVRLEGRVQDSHGRAIPDAWVQVETWRADPSSGSLYASAQTAADGRFVADGLLPGDYRVSARCEAGRGSAGPVLAGPLGAPIEVTVGGELRWTVRVLDEARVPVEGAAVLLEPDPESSAAPGLSSVRVHTDRGGEARFLDVPVGAWKARVENFGARAGSALPIAVNLGRHPSPGTDLVLQPSGALTLRIVDGDGCGVPGLALRLGPEGPQSGGSSWVKATDDYGYASWPRIPAGSYEVRSSPCRTDAEAGEEPVPLWVVLRSELTVDAGEQVTQAQLRLNLPTLHVHVRLRGGPATGARVGLVPYSSVPELAVRLMDSGDSGRCDGRGQAVLVAPGPGSYTVFARSCIEAPAVLVDVELGRGGQHVWVDLAPAEVSGQVVDQDGQPVPNAIARLVPRRFAGIDCNVFTSRQDQDLDLRIGETATWTGPDGRFVFECVPDGEYRVAVSALHHAPWSGGWILVTGEGATLAPVELSARSSLSGRVRSGESAPDLRSGCALAILRDVEGGYVTSSPISPAGNYAFSDLPVETYELEVRHGERVRLQTVSLRPGPNPVRTIQLE